LEAEKTRVESSCLTLTFLCNLARFLISLPPEPTPAEKHPQQIHLHLRFKSRWNTFIRQRELVLGVKLRVLYLIGRCPALSALVSFEIRSFFMPGPSWTRIIVEDKRHQPLY
jgi:hypothetical protein